MAISYLARTKVNGTSVSSLTVAFDCAGTSNTAVFAGVMLASSDELTDVKYNGVALTLINKVQVSGDRYVYLLYLVNPASGSNNMVATFSGTVDYPRMAIVSYDGVKQSGDIIPHNATHNTSGTTSAADLDTSSAPSTDNCWTIWYGRSGAENFKASTTVNATFRQGELDTEDNSNTTAIYDSNGPITPAGSYTMTIGLMGSSNVGSVMASIAPAVASGPTNVKTVNGLAAASVKTVNGLAIASVKSINGLA